jgi:cell filamentation protein, protein adenylyltransferase
MDASSRLHFHSALRSLHPLSPDEIARSSAIEADLAIEAVFASNALAGNVLTFAETARIIATGIAVGGKPLRDHLQAVDHAEALRFVFDCSARSRVLTPRALREIHALVVRRSRPDVAGRYRTVPAARNGADYAPPVAVFVPESVDGLLEDYAARRDIEHPVILAADLHRGVFDIDPFEEGSGRTARLAMNLHLLQHGYPLTIVYPAERAQYGEAIRLCRSEATGNAFRTFLIEAVSRSLERYRDALEPANLEPDA